MTDTDPKAELLDAIFLAAQESDVEDILERMGIEDDEFFDALHERLGRFIRDLVESLQEE